MLVLTRKSKQAVMVGPLGEVTIRVLKIEDGFVKLGIEADKLIPVHREEIFLAKLKERVPTDKKNQDNSNQNKSKESQHD